MRPTRHQLYLDMAFAWANRSLCSLPDRKCGAVITTGDLRQVLSIGYNGPAKGLRDSYCAEWRRSHPSGHSMNLSRCPCLHAEDNAIAFVDGSLPDKAIFITMSPCLICAQRIVNANITKVFFRDVYRDIEPLTLLGDAGVKTFKLASTGEFTPTIFHDLKGT